jgi:hypothetical protein
MALGVFFSYEACPSLGNTSTKDDKGRGQPSTETTGPEVSSHGGMRHFSHFGVLSDSILLTGQLFVFPGICRVL